MPRIKSKSLILKFGSLYQFLLIIVSGVSGIPLSVRTRLLADQKLFQSKGGLIKWLSGRVLAANVSPFESNGKHILNQFNRCVCDGGGGSV